MDVEVGRCVCEGGRGEVEVEGGGEGKGGRGQEARRERRSCVRERRGGGVSKREGGEGGLCHLSPSLRPSPPPIFASDLLVKPCQ